MNMDLHPVVLEFSVPARQQRAQAQALVKGCGLADKLGEVRLQTFSVPTRGTEA